MPYSENINILPSNLQLKALTFRSNCSLFYNGTDMNWGSLKESLLKDNATLKSFREIALKSYESTSAVMTEINDHVSSITGKLKPDILEDEINKMLSSTNSCNSVYRTVFSYNITGDILQPLIITIRTIQVKEVARVYLSILLVKLPQSDT